MAWKKITATVALIIIPFLSIKPQETNSIELGLDYIRSGINQMREGKEKLNGYIEQARDNYWRSFTHMGADNQVVEEEFEHALYVKDLHFLFQHLGNKLPGGRIAQYFSGSAVDGGIISEAQPLFDIWAEKMSSQLSAYDFDLKTIIFSTDKQLWTKAFENNKSFYINYKKKRNRLEFGDIGEISDPKARYLMALSGNVPCILKSRDVYNNLVDIYGKGTVDNTLQIVYESPKTEKGRLLNLEQLKLLPEKRADNPKTTPLPAGFSYIRHNDAAHALNALLLRTSSPKAYYLGSISAMTSSCVLNYDYDSYDEMETVVGNEQLTTAIETIKNAKKSIHNKIIDPQSLGLKSYNLEWAFRDLLLKDDTNLLRYLISIELKEKNQRPTQAGIDIKHQQILQKYTGEQLNTALREVRTDFNPSYSKFSTLLEPKSASSPIFEIWDSWPVGAKSIWLKYQDLPKSIPMKDTVSVEIEEKHNGKIILRAKTSRGFPKEGRTMEILSFNEGREEYFNIPDMFSYAYQETIKEKDTLIDLGPNQIQVVKKIFKSTFNDSNITEVWESDEIPGRLVYVNQEGNQSFLNAKYKLQSYTLNGNNWTTVIEKTEFENKCPSIERAIKRAELTEGDQSTLESKINFQEESVRAYFAADFAVSKDGKAYNVVIKDWYKNVPNWLKKEIERILLESKFTPGQDANGKNVCSKLYYTFRINR